MTTHSVPTQRALLSPRDLIYVGLFSALYIMVAAIAMLGLLNPILFIPALMIVVLGNGVTVMVFFRKVPRIGGLLIIGLIMGLFITIAGHPAVTLLLITITSLIAEAIRYFGRTHTSWSEIIAYAVFSLWVGGPLFPIFYMPTQYFDALNQRMAHRYPGFGDALQAIVSPGVLIGFEIVIFITAIAGGLIGRALVKKHFQRAGVV